MLHDLLWRLNNDLARECLQHPFVQGLGDGSLDRTAFRHYIAQDAFFLRAFLQAYALAVAKSDNVDHAQQLHQLMGGVLDELKLHAEYAAKLEIDLIHVEPFSATRAYTDFLLRTAWNDEIDNIVAAMAPCMRLYAFLGAELAGSLHSEHPYEDWITTYSSDDFRSLVQQLESLLDNVASDTPNVRDAYRYAMQCELDFFSADDHLPVSVGPSLARVSRPGGRCQRPTDTSE